MFSFLLRKCNEFQYFFPNTRNGLFRTKPKLIQPLFHSHQNHLRLRFLHILHFFSSLYIHLSRLESFSNLIFSRSLSSFNSSIAATSFTHTYLVDEHDDDSAFRCNPNFSHHGSIRSVYASISISE